MDGNSDKNVDGLCCDRRIMAKMGVGLASNEHTAFMEVASSRAFAGPVKDGEEYVNYVKLIKHLN